MVISQMPSKFILIQLVTSLKLSYRKTMRMLNWLSIISMGHWLKILLSTKIDLKKLPLMFPISKMEFI